MDINVLIQSLTEGLTPEQAEVVRNAVQRDAVKGKVTGWKQESEYNDIVARSQTLQQEMEGDAAQGKAGLKAYKEWYDKNFPHVQQLQKDMNTYQEKYGSLNAANPNPQSGKTYSDADIQRLVDERLQNNFTPQFANSMALVSKLIQKHTLAGRKTIIDIEDLAKTANTKFGGNLEAAYEDWDKPEREKLANEHNESEIKRRVDEEVQKRSSSSGFPPAADAGPGMLSSRPADASKSFNRSSLLGEMANDWNKQQVN